MSCELDGQSYESSSIVLGDLGQLEAISVSIRTRDLSSNREAGMQSYLERPDIL